MSKTWHSEGMDEVDGAPCDRMASQMYGKPGFENQVKEHNQYDSLLDSGLGSLGSNASLSDGMARLELAEEAHQRNVCSSIAEEPGYFSMDASEDSTETQTAIEQKAEEEQKHDVDILFEQDQDGDTKLHIAIAQCASTVAKQIIDLAPTPDHLNRINIQKLSPLHMAVLTNQPEIARHLLLNGAMLEIRDEDGNTPLHLACSLGHQKCVEALTEPLTGSESVITGSIPFQQIPQDMDLKNYEGYTSMHLAGQQSQTDILSYLYGTSVRADVNARDGLSGRTVLHHAADVGNIQLAHFLIGQCNANVNVCAYGGCTPLHLAIGRNHQHMINLLVEAGANQPSADSSSESDSSSDDEMMDSFDDFTISSQTTTALCR